MASGQLLFGALGLQCVIQKTPPNHVMATLCKSSSTNLLQPSLQPLQTTSESLQLPSHGHLGLREDRRLGTQPTHQLLHSVRKERKVTHERKTEEEREEEEGGRRRREGGGGGREKEGEREKEEERGRKGGGGGGKGGRGREDKI